MKWKRKQGKNKKTKQGTAKKKRADVRRKETCQWNKT